MSLPVGKVAIPALAAAAYTPKQTMTKKHSSSKMESIKERLTITTTEHKSVSAKRLHFSSFKCATVHGLCGSERSVSQSGLMVRPSTFTRITANVSKVRRSYVQT